MKWIWYEHLAQLLRKFFEGQTVFGNIWKILTHNLKTIRAVTSEPYCVKANRFRDILVNVCLVLHTKMKVIWYHKKTKQLQYVEMYPEMTKCLVLNVWSGILRSIRAVSSEPYSVKACGLWDILVHICLELHTKNERNLIWWYDQTITIYIESSHCFCQIFVHFRP